MNLKPAPFFLTPPAVRSLTGGASNHFGTTLVPVEAMRLVDQPRASAEPCPAQDETPADWPADWPDAPLPEELGASAPSREAMIAQLMRRPTIKRPGVLISLQARRAGKTARREMIGEIAEKLAARRAEEGEEA